MESFASTNSIVALDAEIFCFGFKRSLTQLFGFKGSLTQLPHVLGHSAAPLPFSVIAPSSHPSSAMPSSTAICVCPIFSPNTLKNLVRNPSGGPLSMMSLIIIVVKPIERSCFSDCTRDNVMSVAIHFVTALMRRGVRKL